MRTPVSRVGEGGREREEGVEDERGLGFRMSGGGWCILGGAGGRVGGGGGICPGGMCARRAPLDAEIDPTGDGNVIRVAAVEDMWLR